MAKRPSALSPHSAATAAQLFKAYADPTRLRILHLLVKVGELCVGDIAEVLQVAQPTASRHLAYLRRGGLVEVRQMGLWVYYRIAEPPGCLGRLLAECIGGCLDQAAEMRADLARLAEVRAAGGCCAPTPPTRAVPVPALLRRSRRSRQR